MVMILGSVLLFTVISSTVFLTPRLRTRYWRDLLTSPPA
jgi:hypothetical protein